MKLRPFAIVSAFAVLAAGAPFGAFAQVALENKSIAYIVTQKEYAVYATEEVKDTCPHGLNQWGPREQFKALFPDDGTERTYLDTAMAFEARVWFPDAPELKSKYPAERFPFSEAQGDVSEGLDLDGKIGKEDFKSPEGVKGVDNQLYRATGCIPWYRTPKTSKYMQDQNFNRIVVEITGVESLVDDDEVMLTTYRGSDSLALSANGDDFLPMASQHLDEERGKVFIQHFPGRIKNGVLETAPADGLFPETLGGSVHTLPLRDLRWRLTLTADGAEGLVGGYVDIKEFYFHLNKSFNTHYQTYYQLSSPSFYLTLKKLADAYPDPVTGENAAISMAFRVGLKQVFVIHLNENESNFTSEAAE